MQTRAYLALDSGLAVRECPKRFAHFRRQPAEQLVTGEFEERIEAWSGRYGSCRAREH